MPPQATLKCTVLTTNEEWAAALAPDADKGCLAVVECYASWCGPSDAATSTLTKMSVEMAGRRLKVLPGTLLAPDALHCADRHDATG